MSSNDRNIAPKEQSNANSYSDLKKRRESSQAASILQSEARTKPASNICFLHSSRTSGQTSRQEQEQAGLCLMYYMQKNYFRSLWTKCRTPILKMLIQLYFLKKRISPQSNNNLVPFQNFFRTIGNEVIM